MRSRSCFAAAVALALISTFADSRVSAQNGNGNGQGQGPQQGADAQLEGTLEVLIEDSRSGSQTHHFVETANGRFRVKPNAQFDELAGLGSGTKIRARGRFNNGALELNGNGGSVDTMALATSNTFGQQKVVVIMVNFSDNQSAPYGWSHAQNVIFNQANSFFQENSYGQTSLVGDVFGWFTIGMSGSSCDPYQLASLADQAAQRAGVNLGNYSRKVYAFPSNACVWWGLGSVGGSPSRAWINGDLAVKVVAHELGHNFGDYHSRSEPCDSGGCSLIEYGDDRDMMGGYAIGHFNAFQKERLGWLGSGSSPTIQNVNSAGTYFVSSLQTPGTGPKALRVLKSSADNTFYYVEARTQTGFDAGYGGGVILHTGSTSNGDSSAQVDLDRLSGGFDSVLDPGQRFDDQGAGFWVQTISSDSTGAWVEIGYAGTPCTSRTPTVSLSPSSSLLVSPSIPASFSVSVRNNDEIGCPAVTFSNWVGVQSGWTSTTDRSSVQVSPGGSASFVATVTAPEGASGSSRADIQLNRSGGANGPAGFAVANLVVVTALDVTLTVSGGNQPQMSVSVRAGGSPVQGASVRFTITDPRGGIQSLNATTTSTGVAAVRTRLKGKDPKGTYLVAATVTAGGLLGSATGSFIF